MSKIVRNVTDAPVVFIGERQRDLQAETKAVRILAEHYPTVECITSGDDVKFIPITEVVKFERALQQAQESARDEGYQSGHEAGVRKGLDEARQVLARFDQAIKDAVTQRETLLQQAKSRILELVLQVSRKVTFDAIEADREATVELINGVINQLIDRSRLKIRVHPDFLPIMEQNMNRFLSSSAAIKEITFEADPRVRHGGCFIETPTGDIDARIESQFDVIADTLVGAEESA
ncbi:MAG: FliH/SctL family protein [Candidatus Zixiibacteriota bacterium]